ncbi:MAG: phage tail assembly chaperone [Parvibaculaceae bacterium]
MQLGMGRLGLAPRDFWSMTLRELNAALGLTAHAQGMTRGDLNSLLELYPDE